MKIKNENNDKKSQIFLPCILFLQVKYFDIFEIALNLIRQISINFI